MPNFKISEVVDFAIENSQILNEPVRKKSITNGSINHIKENIRLQGKINIVKDI